MDGLRRVAIPDSSKSFLVEVGLPLHGAWMLKFDDGAAQLPPLPNKPHCRRIGFDYIVPICLDEGRGGCVVEAKEEFGYPERYINSSVELFGECLVYYQQYRVKGRLMREGNVSTLVAATARLLRKADPKAFGDDESWWPLTVEQMENGML